MLARRVHTTQFTHSYSSTKCNGAGNGRSQSTITARLRRQVNKMRREFLKKDLQREIGL